MNEKKAREILKDCIRKDGRLRNTDHYIHWDVSEKKVTLDCDFKAEQLEAVTWWMRNQATKQPSSTLDT